MISDHQSWSTPPLIQGDMTDEAIEENIVEPACNAISEEILRSHFPPFGDLEKVEFSEVGTWPFRWKNGNRVYPFTNSERDGEIVSDLNPEYEEHGLTEVVKRLKPGKTGPKFTITKKRVPSGEGFQILIDVTMTDFNLDDFEVGVRTT